LRTHSTSAPNYFSVKSYTERIDPSSFFFPVE
jgi:hypothetical protein